MNTVCPHCQKQLEMSDDMLGKQASCPACQKEFSVTRLQDSTGSSPPTAGVPAAWQPSPYIPNRQMALNLTPPKWLLLIGLILVGFTGAGPERIICLVMIAIITFSIYIGGMAWIPSMLNSIVGGVQSIAQTMDRMF